MCSVGDAFGVDIEGGMEVHNYVCNQCRNEFKGIGMEMTCPKCQSKYVKRIE